jgi:nicotinate phosphoribosyltransferase
MTIFNKKRLTNAVFKLDIERMRQGWYSDKYFANILKMLGGSWGEQWLPGRLRT